MDFQTGPVVPVAPADDTRARDIIERIAEVLGRSVADFDEAKPPGIDAGATDLLECWMALRSETARARVLATARAAVAAQTD